MYVRGGAFSVCVCVGGGGPNYPHTPLNTIVDALVMPYNIFFIPHTTRSPLTDEGALVMPYNIFFQSSIVNARPRDNDSEAKISMLLL